MAPSPSESVSFPDDVRADVFVREFRTAVVPPDRKGLATRPPLFVLRVPGDAAAYERGVHRVVEALRQSIDQNGRLVPYAHLAAVKEESASLAATAGRAFAAPAT